MKTEASWLDNELSIFIPELNTNIDIENISNIKNNNLDYNYKIGKGDQVSITVWGLPDIFPISNITPDQNLRRVDSNGNIFSICRNCKSRRTNSRYLRENIANKLSTYFKDPQLDLSIARFNSQRVYLLGEVINPIKINITDIPLSLTEALGQTKGINNNTANGGEVFVIRQSNDNSPPRIFIADLSSPAGFLSAGSFYLSDNDVVYVNAKGTTRWNRVISQFFPFSSFLNSIDNLSDGQ